MTETNNFLNDDFSQPYTITDVWKLNVALSPWIACEDIDWRMDFETCGRHCGLFVERM
jgi:hypothetical protein